MTDLPTLGGTFSAFAINEREQIVERSQYYLPVGVACRSLGNEVL